MKYETKLHQAKGLGPAKSGVSHWIIQRITAVALIPLSLWFVGSFVFLLTIPYAEAYAWFSSPWAVVFAMLFMLVLFYHGYLGIQVILEDYVSHEYTRWCLIVFTQLLSAGLALLATVSLLKIFLS